MCACYVYICQLCTSKRSIFLVAKCSVLEFVLSDLLSLASRKGTVTRDGYFFMFIPFQSILSTFVLMGLRIVVKLTL